MTHPADLVTEVEQAMEDAYERWLADGAKAGDDMTYEAIAALDARDAWLVQQPVSGEGRVPDTTHFQQYDPDTEDVYPKGQVADLQTQLEQALAARPVIQPVAGDEELGMFIWDVMRDTGDDFATTGRMVREYLAARSIAPEVPDEFEITVPCWATSLTVEQAGDEWIATVIGDPRGVGTDVKTTCQGPNPQATVCAVTDKAEGWTRFGIATAVSDEKTS